MTKLLFTNFLNETKYGHQDCTKATERIPTERSQPHSSNEVTRPNPYLRTGPRGPVPGRQIFRGGILKKSRLKCGMREKKAVHEREI